MGGAARTPPADESMSLFEHIAALVAPAPKPDAPPGNATANNAADAAPSATANTTDTKERGAREAAEGAGVPGANASANASTPSTANEVEPGSSTGEKPGREKGGPPLVQGGAAVAAVEGRVEEPAGVAAEGGTNKKAGGAAAVEGGVVGGAAGGVAPEGGTVVVRSATPLPQPLSVIGRLFLFLFPSLSLSPPQPLLTHKSGVPGATAPPRPRRGGRRMQFRVGGRWAGLCWRSGRRVSRLLGARASRAGAGAARLAREALPATWRRPLAAGRGERPIHPPRMWWERRRRTPPQRRVRGWASARRAGLRAEGRGRMRWMGRMSSRLQPLAGTGMRLWLTGGQWAPCRTGRGGRGTTALLGGGGWQERGRP